MAYFLFQICSCDDQSARKPTKDSVLSSQQNYQVRGGVKFLSSSFYWLEIYIKKYLQLK